MGLVPLQEEEETPGFALSLPCEDPVICESGRGALPGVNRADSLILDFQSLEP